MSHPRPRLSVFSRQLLVRRVLVLGWPASHVAEQLGISRATAYEWLRRYRSEGEGGLRDRSSRPHRSHDVCWSVEGGILAARSAWRYAPDRWGPLLGLPPSTVHRVLARRAVSRLRDTDRVTAAPVRYQACHPGALLHQDHKARSHPDGGGWRVHGRGRDRHGGHSRAGYEHLEVIVDDASRDAVVVPVPDETAASAITALEIPIAEFARLASASSVS